ncbi:hypothetical protein KKD81_02445 [Patescibacteria group bacterium]|nr:hypothetical protein [Patescibacteria group bacterium]MBU2158880.1 hypothetical protein [Patescibacteria group bacterium]MBU2220776.1 hypothetical protein [Patescibacteria group bacterium]
MIRSSHFFILLAISVAVLAAGLYYAFVVMAPAEVVVEEEKPTVIQTVAPGEYFVTISSVSEFGEETKLSMEHVTYFEGDAARASAESEVVCGAAIETCVPSLEDGYYVRPSGAPGFTLELSEAATLSLLDQPEQSPEALKKLLIAADPVFVVTIEGEQVVRVVQKTP